MFTLARASVEYGVSSEGLTTKVQPAAKAAEALRANMEDGKFH